MHKIKTGIASFGLSGQVFHAPFLNIHEGFELKVIAERSKDLARAQYPHVKTVRTFDELLAEEIDLVVVNTPVQTHFDYCKQALLAGKHVVVEKPFVATVAEAEELIALANKQGKLLTVFQNRRYDGDFLTVRQILQSGVLGRVVEFQSSFQRYRPDINSARAQWREEPLPGNGITYDLGSHLCDQVLVLFGKPSGIWAHIAIQRQGSRVDDYSLIQMLYPDLIVTLRAGMLIREEGPRFALHGTRGSYVKFGLDPQEGLLRTGHAIPNRGPWAAESDAEWGILNTDDGRRKYPTIPGNYLGYYDAIYDTLCKGAQPPVSHNDMLTDLRILEAAFKSSQTGRVITVE